MIKHGLYNIFGAIFRLGVTVTTIPLLIRLIGLEEYGLWTIAFTVVSIVTLAEAGLSTSTTFFLSKDLLDQNENSISQTLTVSFVSMFALAVLSGMGLWIAAPYLTDAFPKLTVAQHQVIVPAFRWAGIVVWTKLLQRICVGIQQAYQRYGLLNLITTAQTGVVYLGMVAVAYLKGRTLELMQLQVVANLLFLFIHLVAAYRVVKIRFIWNRVRFIEIFRYSSMTWLSSVSSALFSQGDKVIVGSLLSTSSLGVYAAITSITSQINAFSALPIQPLLPHLSRFSDSIELQRSQLVPIVRQAFHINACVAMALGGILLGFSSIILPLLLPNENISQYRQIFYIAVLIYTMYSVNVVGYYVLFGVDKVSLCLKNQIFSGLLCLLMITVGAKTFGLIGAVLGNTGYVLTLWLNSLSMKEIQVSELTWLKWSGPFYGLFLLALIFLLLGPNKVIYGSVITTVYLMLLSAKFFQLYPSTRKSITAIIFPVNHS